MRIKPTYEMQSCPCCGQNVKLYRRPINATMARDLVKLYKLDERAPGEYFHVSRFLVRLSGDFSKLSFWGLIDALPNEDDPSKRTVGLWRMTELGRSYVEGSALLHKYVLTYNQKVYGFNGPQVSILDALSTKFDYSELMK